MSNTGPESGVPSAASGGGGAGLRPAGADAGRWPDVVLYHAAGCHLCERARRTVAGLRAELGFSLTEVDITGVPELEASYRELIPVVEIDGARAFTYHVHPEAFRRRVEGAQTRRRSLGL